MSAPPGMHRPAAAVAVLVGGAALFVDAAIETFLAGSPARLWTTAAAALYAAAAALMWRRRVGWRAVLTVGILGLLVLIAATAWLPDGLTSGLRVAGQTTARIMAIVVAAAIALGGLAIVPAKLAPRPLGSGVRRERARERPATNLRVGAREHVLGSVSRPAARIGRSADGSPRQQPRPRRAARDAAEADGSAGPARPRLTLASTSRGTDAGASSRAIRRSVADESGSSRRRSKGRRGPLRARRGVAPPDVLGAGRTR
jgi:hypothetical protein